MGHMMTSPHESFLTSALSRVPQLPADLTVCAGASSAALVKGLEVQGFCLAELSLQHRDAPAEGLASNQQTVDSDTPGQVGGVMGIPGQPVQAPADAQLHGGVTGLTPVSATCLHRLWCQLRPGASSF